NRIQLQRSGLALWNGVLYIAFASYGDWGKYHGWILAYAAKDLKLVDSYVAAPHGYGSGIWQSGQALAIDDKTGYVFFTTGNDFELDENSVNENRSNAVGALKLSAAGTLDVTDWFTPHDWRALDIKDQDLGSSGVLLIPNTDLALTGSKAG